MKKTLKKLKEYVEEKNPGSIECYIPKFNINIIVSKNLIIPQEIMCYHIQFSTKNHSYYSRKYIDNFVIPKKDEFYVVLREITDALFCFLCELEKKI